MTPAPSSFTIPHPSPARPRVFPHPRCPCQFPPPQDNNLDTTIGCPSFRSDHGSGHADVYLIGHPPSPAGGEPTLRDLDSKINTLQRDMDIKIHRLDAMLHHRDDQHNEFEAGVNN
ncbi:hypothetical protein L873DRAFT_1817823 [Choiromyces venosus 120613-1]|uniref:Uncharacterized protein n=1 Tax=Choiromyces venosus 120613-1 TaxID=1336337 RepID=A0A3N4J5D8_9PEZI|nr:hypothetical protein L873DRAFT_1817823 [Choiromyces venosus 120613-1]